jgi:hypothetical protein
MHTTALALAPVAAFALALAACDVSVRDGDRGESVDVRTPVADISVRTEEPADTGLPVYPGAQLQRNESGRDNANVRIDMPFVDVQVAAATFHSADAPETIAAFYAKELRTYGEVTECRGELDFRESGPVCRQNGSGTTQLGAGTENDHRMVVIKPRRGASEFSVVYVRTRT